MNAAQMKSKCSKTQIEVQFVWLMHLEMKWGKKIPLTRSHSRFDAGKLNKKKRRNLVFNDDLFRIQSQIPRRSENETRFKRDNQKWGDTTSICIEQMCNVMKLNRESEAIACAHTHTHLIASYITARWYCNMVIIWHHPAWMTHIQRMCECVRQCTEFAAPEFYLCTSIYSRINTGIGKILLQHIINMYYGISGKWLCWNIIWWICSRDRHRRWQRQRQQSKC